MEGILGTLPPLFSDLQSLLEVSPAPGLRFAPPQAAAGTLGRHMPHCPPGGVQQVPGAQAASSSAQALLPVPQLQVLLSLMALPSL